MQFVGPSASVTSVARAFRAMSASAGPPSCNRRGGRLAEHRRFLRIQRLHRRATRARSRQPPVLLRGGSPVIEAHLGERYTAQWVLARSGARSAGLGCPSSNSCGSTRSGNSWPAVSPAGSSEVGSSSRHSSSAASSAAPAASGNGDRHSRVLGPRAGVAELTHRTVAAGRGHMRPRQYHECASATAPAGDSGHQAKVGRVVGGHATRSGAMARRASSRRAPVPCLAPCVASVTPGSTCAWPLRPSCGQITATCTHGQLSDPWPSRTWRP